MNEHSATIASGTVELANRATGGINGSPELLGGHIHLWAQAPRYAWIDASLVTFVSNLSLRLDHHVVGLRGHGHLLPTFKSPAMGSFTIAGLASLTLRPAASSAKGRRRGVLVLGFDVSNSAGADR